MNIRLNNIFKISSIILGLVTNSWAQAVNPATTNYVDQKVADAIGKSSAYSAGENITFTTGPNNSTMINATGGGSTTTYALGKPGQGGIIFYLDPTKQHGLVVALEDQTGTDGIVWSNNPALTSAGSCASGVYLGAQNTHSILNSQDAAGTCAASLCKDYNITVDDIIYNDWYLPSLNELSLMYQQRNNIIQAGGDPFKPNQYWSSTEIGSNISAGTAYTYASTINMDPTSVNTDNFNGPGISASVNKSVLCRVRAIRAF